MSTTSFERIRLQVVTVMFVSEACAFADEQATISSQLDRWSPIPNTEPSA